MTSRGIRTARGIAAACFAVFVAALFHDAAGGGLPSPLAVALALAFAAPLCIALAGRRITLWRQAASVAVSQLLLHLLFGLGGDSTGTTLNAPVGHLHAGMQIGITGGHAVAMRDDTAPMLLAHVAAAIVTVAALRHGERTIAALANFTVLLVTAIAKLDVSPVPVAVRMPVQTRPLTLRAPALVLGSLRHRGPPLLSPAV
jgi:hypothetical protein